MATITKLKEHLENCGKIRRKPFKVTHTGFYKTRDGRKVFVSVVGEGTCIGIIEGEGDSRLWDRRGFYLYWDDEESPEDIVEEWED